MADPNVFGVTVNQTLAVEMQYDVETQSFFFAELFEAPSVTRSNAKGFIEDFLLINSEEYGFMKYNNNSLSLFTTYSQQSSPYL